MSSLNVVCCATPKYTGMKNVLHLILFVAVSLFFYSCQRNVIYETSEERDQVKADYTTKQKLLPGVSMEIEGMHSPDVMDALEFLYAYMPLSDIIDYPMAFYKMNVDYALRTRSEMPWGEKVPAQLFRHFVLPVRVNNESLDEARMIFYETLCQRVKSLSMQEAILEVNHWSREKLIERPSNMRTSSPLSTMKSAQGRQGEGSVFLVAALRAVGIPARQVYMPRWTHDDGNHAWVEAWADGEWYFVGACEPEAVLNLSSINVPASREILIQARVFGRYNGPEPKLSETSNYTEIAVTDTYAPTAELKVTVVDAQGKPVPDARVDFKNYSNAGFYTLASQSADSTGMVSFRAGKGDLLVWATNGIMHGFSKASFGTQEELRIVLDKQPVAMYKTAFEMAPPPESAVLPEVTPQQRADNARRLAGEDSIRKAYVAGFPDLQKAELQLVEMGYSGELAPLLVASCGNYGTLVAFLKEVAAEDRPVAVRLLQLLTTKDLRDVSPQALRDHFTQARPYRLLNGVHNPWFDFILNPRVGFEMLVPYRSYLLSSVGDALAAAFRTAPASLVEWCAREIQISTTFYTEGLITSPSGVWKAKKSDPLSRDIFFVALARSMGIPAWRDAVDGRVYYVDFSQKKDKGEVKVANLSLTVKSDIPMGRLSLRYYRTPQLDDPRYGTHFTLSRYDSGSYRLLQYDGSKVTWSNTFAWGGSPIAAGDYLLTTGTRRDDGTVLTHLTFFRVGTQWTTYVPLVIIEH